MQRLAVVTYTRSGEKLTDELIEIGQRLSQLGYPMVMHWYYESDTAERGEDAPDIGFELKHHQVSGTKYRKLLHQLYCSDSDYILSLDNDIDAVPDNLVRLVQDTLNHGYDLSWGRVCSRNVNGFVSNLVSVDKLLSHTVLRPLLWEFGLGVTLPGQCFMLKVSAFKGRLPETDTFLDDLSIGVFAAKNRLSYLYSHETVVRELPSYTFSVLLKQRARWAVGYKQCLSCPSLDRKDKQLLYIHGFVYHLLPLALFAVLLFLLLMAPVSFAVLLALLSGVATRCDLKSFAYGLIYPLVFPIFHLRWLQCLIKE